MSTRISLVLTLLLLLTDFSIARADENIPVLTVGSEVYSNLTVTSVSATDVYFTYPAGMANVKLKQLSPEWQKHFNFDPDKARAAELQQADNKTRYHDEIIHPPVPPKTVIILAPLVWRDNLPAALSQAQAENKPVLLAFTGSDWSQWCVKFDHDVLSTPQFALYAQHQLVLVRLDFPKHLVQSDDLRKANEALIKQFAITEFPTYVLLGSDGKELGRQVGYLAGGPPVFITELDSFSKR